MVDELELAEFAENPESRVPCVLLLDRSGSMSGEPIAQLNEGLRTFEEELQKDEMASLRAEVAIVEFGPVTVRQDFIGAGSFRAPAFSADGGTPMGAAIEKALDLLEERKQLYRSAGVSYYRPWVFLITDGAPTDDWQEAARRVHEMEAGKHVAFFAVGVKGADFETLKQISVRAPLALQELKFKELFLWLSGSLSGVAHSEPEDEVPLQTPIGWAVL